MMKRLNTRKILILLGLSLPVLQLISNSAGAPTGRSGAPGDLTCQNGSCHNTFPLNSGEAITSISSDIPETGYIPGNTYSVHLKIKEPGVTRFGFEALAYGTASSDGVGSVSITDNTRTQVKLQGIREYITHTGAGIGNTDSAEWSFDWTAPEVGTGEVGIFASLLGANQALNGPAGDRVYKDSLVVQEAAGDAIDPELAIKHLTVYPIESDQNLKLDLIVDQPADFDLMILDLQGRQLYHYHAFYGAGIYPMQIATHSWPAGVYMIRIQNGAAWASRKFVKP